MKQVKEEALPFDDINKIGLDEILKLDSYQTYLKLKSLERDIEYVVPVVVYMVGGDKGWARVNGNFIPVHIFDDESVSFRDWYVH